MLDSDTGKLYSLYWGESDNFKKLQVKEITMEQAVEDCTHSLDYVTMQRLDDVVRSLEVR